MTASEMSTVYRTPPTQLVGMLLNGRYELTEFIRYEGSIRLYRGWDSSLFRVVQLSVLPPTNSAEVASFRSAIKAAAELMFQHTVMVYDAGAQSTVEGRFWWAASEYFEADLPAKLTASDVLNLARQLASTMAQAHAAKIVHGKLSPHNVLVAADLQLRIAGFGEAESKSSTAADVVGFQTILRHWLARCPAASPLRRRLSQIAERCGTGLLDFEAIVRSLDVPLRRPPRTAPLPVIAAPNTGTRVSANTPPALANAPKKRAQQRNSAIAVPGFAIVILLGLIAAVWGLSTLNSEPAAALRIPNVYGLSPDEAKTKLNTAGFELGGQRSEPSTSLPAGQILSTDPASGQRADSGSFVVLVLSAGKPKVTVPPAVGNSAQKFSAKLVALGLRVNVVEKDGVGTAGTVLGVSPAAGSSVEAESIIQVSAASGYQTVPSGLVGKASKDAVAALHAAGFTAQIAKAPGFGAAPGTVLAIAPSTRAAVKGIVTMSVAADQ